MKNPGNRCWCGLLGLSGLLLFSIASAQPQIELEFESMFGQQAPFVPGFPQPPPPSGFSTPTGVSFSSENTIVVADRGNSKVQHCDLQGQCVWLGAPSGQFKNQAGTFDLPNGVDADRRGFYAVADEDNHAVQWCSLTNGGCVYKGTKNSQSNPPSTSLGH